MSGIIYAHRRMYRNVLGAGLSAGNLPKTILQARSSKRRARIVGESKTMRELENCFKALADVNRLRIMNLLLHGELCVCDIHRVLECAQPNVSRHLAYLRNAGLVLDRRDGLRMFYRLNEAALVPAGLFEFLRGAFSRQKALQDDMRRLKQAVQAGHCTMTEWRAFSAIGSGRQAAERA